MQYISYATREVNYQQHNINCNILPFQGSTPKRSNGLHIDTREEMSNYIQGNLDPQQESRFPCILSEDRDFLSFV